MRHKKKSPSLCCLCWKFTYECPGFPSPSVQICSWLQRIIYVFILKDACMFESPRINLPQSMFVPWCLWCIFPHPFYTFWHKPRQQNGFLGLELMFQLFGSNSAVIIWAVNLFGVQNKKCPSLALAEAFSVECLRQANLHLSRVFCFLFFSLTRFTV